jgi:hypothetical protein
VGLGKNRQLSLNVRNIFARSSAEQQQQQLQWWSVCGPAKENAMKNKSKHAGLVWLSAMVLEGIAKPTTFC